MTPRAMTRYTFEEVRYPAAKALSCMTCGKKVRRRETFWATLNPFNVNEFGQPRSRTEIIAVLRDKASAWMGEPVECTACLRVRVR